MEDVKIIATAAEIDDFLHLRNTGYGSGDGRGDGSGDGSGYGRGDGYGDGDGSGYGDGSGDGYGYGSGDGSGDGSGYGSGDASLLEIEAIAGNRVYVIDNLPSLITAVHGDIASGYILGDDLSFRPCYIARSGNCFAHGATVREAVRDAREKQLEGSPLEERVAQFIEAHPDPDIPVPFRDLYDWHHILTGSCTMGRDEFTRGHGLDTDADYTPRYFIEITRNAYGKDAIQALANAYGINH